MKLTEIVEPADADIEHLKRKYIKAVGHVKVILQQAYMLCDKDYQSPFPTTTIAVANYYLRKTPDILFQSLKNVLARERQWEMAVENDPDRCHAIEKRFLYARNLVVALKDQLLARGIREL